MCGITLVLRHQSGKARAPGLVAMTEAVAHRGPDGSGFTYLESVGGALRPVSADQAWCVGMGHRRLSILDLSPLGAQPMSYRDRLWITYNGEIYNHVELRKELELLGHVFRSTSDTEVLLAAYDEWGTSCFRRMHGMWGLALVDVGRNKIVLSRDRLGIKPLYVAQHAGALAVVSEIKQLAAFDGYQLRADEHAVVRYLQTGYESSHRCFFEGVRPVPAGTVIEVGVRDGAIGEAEPYWWPERVSPTVRDRDEAAQRFRQVLAKSVRYHLRSDVPVGCALSGGLDSSAVAALVREIGGGSNGALHTFTATFPGHEIDERPWVESLVPRIRATAHYTEPSVDSFLQDFDRFLWHHDEPVGSLSQYAGYAVARLTRAAGVPVTLNGQGGDEILHGYWQGYFVYLNRLLRAHRLGEFAPQVIGALLPGGNPEVWRQVPLMFRRYWSKRRPGSVLPLKNGFEIDAGGPELDFVGQSAEAWRVFEIRELFLPRLLKWDDRNFMAFSVEGRYPFLDHEVIETCLSFDQNALYSRGWTKEPLRRGLTDLLPEAILRRRTKLGFETPQERWLKTTGLRRAVEVTLTSDSPVWKYVERRKAQALLDASAFSTQEAGQALFRLFTVDRWMTLHAFA